eukprot:9465926-Pyramimonas_sp.AAC.1
METTRIEEDLARSRVRQWKALAAEAVQTGDKKAHIWSKLPASWQQAGIHPARGIQYHASKLNPDLAELKKIWRLRDGKR